MVCSPAWSTSTPGTRTKPPCALRAATSSRYRLKVEASKSSKCSVMTQNEKPCPRNVETISDRVLQPSCEYVEWKRKVPRIRSDEGITTSAQVLDQPGHEGGRVVSGQQEIVRVPIDEGVEVRGQRRPPGRKVARPVLRLPLQAEEQAFRVTHEIPAPDPNAVACLVGADLETVHHLPVEIGQIESRSEEHTSELQSLRHLVCRLLLEKKNK